MLDIQLLRNNIDAVAQRLATRGYTLDTENFQKLENERKTLQTRTQDLQASRNSLDLVRQGRKRRFVDAGEGIDPHRPNV